MLVLLFFRLVFSHIPFVTKEYFACNYSHSCNEGYNNTAEKASVQRLIDYLDIVKTPHKNTAETPKLYHDFKTFFEQYDVRRNKDFKETFKGPIADWYETLKAEVPTKEDILVKKDTIKIYNRAGDPATTESYEGGDDVHEKVGGWDTENDALGGVKVE